MAITKMTSYDLKGKKLSFANWISNISPTETPFSSMTGKESISQTKFQWQTDVLPAINGGNAQVEGSKPTDDSIIATKVVSNYTQIFRRSVSVSDTANRVQFYGRGQEVGYQMEKASLELKRDIEKALLWQHDSAAHSDGVAGKTAGFLGLVGDPLAAQTWKKYDAIDTSSTDSTAKKYWDQDTKAVTVFETATHQITEKDLFTMTYNLYLANSKANVIMFHPQHAAFFSALVDTPMPASREFRMKMFQGMDDTYNAEVDTVIDPLGQRYALVPNRLMPPEYIYFFNPTDWTQMVLRAPKKIQLAKQGSSQEWMIETELGLRHRNPYASGIMKVGA